MKLNVYLNFAGNTEEAFNFYRSVFGGNFANLTRFKDLPIPGRSFPAEVRDKIMHISLPVGPDTLMASDALPALGHTVAPGNNFSVSVNPDSKEEADRIFNALAAGGKVDMPMAKQPWGDYYGSLTDKFGVQWMVNYSTATATERG